MGGRETRQSMDYCGIVNYRWAEGCGKAEWVYVIRPSAG